MLAQFAARKGLAREEQHRLQASDFLGDILRVVSARGGALAGP
jgi:hypothetical protein